MPSIAHLAEITGQDRKSIIGHIAMLEREGFIADTGERAGATKQIKVYSAAIGTVPKPEQLQKRNSSDSPRKQYQKRDTEPSIEPSYPTDIKALRKAKGEGAPTPAKPDGVSDQVWLDFVRHRKAKNAPVSLTVIAGISREAASAGWTIEKALTECVVRGWRSFKAEWVQNTAGNGFAGPSAGSSGNFLQHMLSKQPAAPNPRPTRLDEQEGAQHGTSSE